MARNRNSTGGGRGVSSPTASNQLPRISIRPLSDLAITPSDYLSQTLSELEDRRFYMPDRSIRPPASVRRSDARLTQDQASKHLRRIRFLHPRQVAMCVRRKVRREVLHAIKVAGRRGIKKYRRNQWSDVGC